MLRNELRGLHFSQRRTSGHCKEPAHCRYSAERHGTILKDMQASNLSVPSGTWQRSLGSRSFQGLAPLASFLAVLAGLLIAVATPQAQTVWTADPKASLAWWQVSPHFNHLWATTCPEEPSWYPGEGRSSAFKIRPPHRKPGSDTLHVPLYPRYQVSIVCSEAVAGRVVLPDTVMWRGARGEVTVRADALVTGDGMRDVMMHQVLETQAFPEIRFTLDSLVNLTKHGDTLFGGAVGTLTVRGVQQLTTAGMKAFPEAGGMRVLAKWHIPATTLQLDLTPKLKYLNLGVNTLIWQDFFMGADLVFRGATAAPIGGGGSH